MWDAFTAAFPEHVDAPYEAWHFCDNQADADELAELVLSGRKRATAGALWSYEAEGEPLPCVGDLHVITDWSGRARCVIRITSVDVVAFDHVTAEFAAVEGEGDASLAFWRKAHRAAFARELAPLGMEPSPDMPVVCQRFEVVFPAGAADAGRRA